jgi:hypothetical protein
VPHHVLGPGSDLRHHTVHVIQVALLGRPSAQRVDLRLRSRSVRSQRQEAEHQPQLLHLTFLGCIRRIKQ